MKDKVSDFLLKRLSEWGIKRIYGFPGDGINGIVGAFDRAGDLIDFVQVRHEEMAAFMACGHAKFTGEVGVCLATSGTGAEFTFLTDFTMQRLDHQPVVPIVGQIYRAGNGGKFKNRKLISSHFQKRRLRIRSTSVTPCPKFAISSTGPCESPKFSVPSPASSSQMICKRLFRGKRNRNIYTTRFIPALEPRDPQYFAQKA